MKKKFTLSEFGYEVTLDKYAKLADGSAWFQQGGTVILSTAVSTPTKDFPGFLPLTTDYREHYAAAGKIPGGYLKREGRSSDKEILVSRLIDRAIRPLFPANFFDQIQVLSTVYSVDKQYPPYALSLLSSSIALITSDIPFLGPIGAVEMARINNEWIFNPTHEQSIISEARIVVAGTEEGIMMVEGQSNQLSESDFLEALFLGHDVIKKQIKWQKEIQSEVNKEKKIVSDKFNFDLWKEKIDSFLSDEKIDSLFVYDKADREKALSGLKESFFEKFDETLKDQDISSSVLEYAFENLLKEKLTEAVFKKGKRLDTRDFDQIRPIDVEVGFLPFNHGSALFTRGKTQALSSVTLGGGKDEQRIEDIMHDTIERSFMLHYNFPPFSVGEVKPLRGPGRREIGHGNLAATSLKHVLPDQEKFPYIIRVVTDILESDGSSSMATVCSATMALMNAGVPISEMVAGIAMGLLVNKNGDFKVISDILGKEDAFGLMDFKVAGTENGITAIQMDVKSKGGLKREVFEQALDQARKGRLHILGEMKKVMSSPNEKLSELVPQVISVKIPKDKIGSVIGPGGKVIREITEKTDTSIDIEEDGTVKIFGHLGENLNHAVMTVKTLSGLIEPGFEYAGKIKKAADFGIFVEIAPGIDGLVHISNIPKNMQQTFKEKFKVGDTLNVQVVDYDAYSNRIRLKIIENKSNNG